MWDWLPAFRAAAEYQSLQRAGLALSVSPSALSRSIKLLEETLGVSLFTRRASGMTMTQQGERLLAATRDAMRRMHAGLIDEPLKTIRLAAVGPALSTLLCEVTAQTLPDWALSLASVAAASALEQLRCGDADVVLSDDPLVSAGITSRALPPLRMVLAVGPGGSATRVAALKEPGQEWAGAHVSAPSVEQLVSLAQHLKTAVFCPSFAVPTGWSVVEQRLLGPVFLLSRDYSDQPPTFIAALGEALETRLQSPLGPTS